MKPITLFAAAALTLSATAVHADRIDPDPKEPTRDSWHLGFGVGFGQMTCDSVQNICEGTIDEAGGLELHIGKMLSPRLSLQGESWVMIHSEDRVTISHAITTFGAQYWVFPRIWIKGGLGFAVARASYDGEIINVSDRTDAVPGFAAGAGWEVVIGKSFAMDLHVRYGTGFYDDDQVRAHNAQVGVGFNWY